MVYAHAQYLLIQNQAGKERSWRYGVWKNREIKKSPSYSSGEEHSSGGQVSVRETNLPAFFVCFRADFDKRSGPGVSPRDAAALRA